MSDGTAKKLYVRWSDDREHYLRRARQAARYTIPSLMPEESHNNSMNLYTPYQGLGTRGLNNLASKLMLILMPPDQPMFKLDVDDFQLRQLLEGQTEGARGDLEAAFGRIERAVTTDLAATTMRRSLAEAIKQLIVAGNVGIFQERDGAAKVYRMDTFVVRRDPRGKLLEAIMLEKIDRSLLTKEQQAVVLADAPNTVDRAEKAVEVYSHLALRNGRHYLYQEINGKVVPGSEREWPEEKTPFIFPTTSRLPGENYGRGYIETVCLGDLISYEGLSKYLLEASAQSAKVLWMRNPNSVTRAKDLEKPNGSIINGSPNDVAALQLQKGADFQFTLSYAQNLERRLEQVFLLHQSVQRSGERVTATEIQFVAQDIEDALGNLYSDLAQDLQLPVVMFQLDRLQKVKRIPNIQSIKGLPKGGIKPRITTGLSALGRGQDLRKIQAFVGDIVQLGPEVVMQHMNFGDFIARLGASHGVDTTGLIKTSEQIAQEQQAAQQAQQRQAMMEGAVPAIAKEGAAAIAPAIVQQFTGQS